MDTCVLAMRFALAVVCFAKIWLVDRLLFGNTQYLTDLIAGRNVIVFVCTFVGVNAVAEALATTAVTGALTAALERSGLLRR